MTITSCEWSNIEENARSTDLNAKIDLITSSASKPYFNKCLKMLAKTNTVNAQTICNYITAEQTEINIKQSTTEGKIKVLVWLSNFHTTKEFKNMDKSDILEFLNSLRKSIVEDRMQRWIGTYNGRQMILNKFFRWLHNPDEPDQKKRMTPACMLGVKKLPIRAQTPYKHIDMWYPKEHAIFLKYCPDKRDRCYHAMVNDMSARPHEILNLRIADIKFNVTDEGIQFAEVRINAGKTGPRVVPLIDSIPFVKEWISEHPTGNNSDSWLFISRGNVKFGNKLTYDGIVNRYSYYYKTKFFPQLLEDKTVPEEDKEVVRSMLSKPWNLYIFRHSALTEKSQILPEAILRSHAGWTMSSKMPQIYIHLGGESSKILLEKRGVIKNVDTNQKNVLSPRMCPHCSECNRPDSRFCFKCKMILSFDTYVETIDKMKEKENRFAIMEKRMDAMSSQVGIVMNSICNLDQRSKYKISKDLYESGILMLEEK